MDLKEIAEAYQLVYEKKKLDPVGKEDDDVDNDGDVDSSDEYLKKRRAAIGKAMGKDGDKEEDEEDKEDKKKDKKESLDLVSAYHSMYEHHKKDADGNTIPHEDEIEEEVEQLNELSPDTLKSYIKKSQDQVKKRKKGIERAVDQAAEKKVLGITVKKPKGFYDEEIDLSFVDELSEEELDNLVEGVVYDLLDEGIELDAIEGAFTVYLEEAKITFGSDTPGEDEEVGTKTRSKKNPTPEEKKTAALKKRKQKRLLKRQRSLKSLLVRQSQE